jgi:hypothetical protein
MKWVGSPNYTPGRQGKQIEFIVCHWIVGTLGAADAAFQSKTRQVSAHYGLNAGAVHQYVHEGDTAWHAGNFDINCKSIGIEHEGGPNLPITDGTYERSAQLIAQICKRYGKRFPLRHHREFVATACPGTLDLNRINRRVDEILNGGTIMDTPAGKLLYNVALHRNAESDGNASQWNGQTPAQALSRMLNEPEWKSVDAKVKGFDALAKQVQELSTRPTKAELEAVAAKASELQAKVEKLEATKSEDTVLLDEAGNWFSKLWNRLFKGGNK